MQILLKIESGHESTLSNVTSSPVATPMKLLMKIRQQEQAIEWDEVKKINHCTFLYAPPCKDKLRHPVIIRQTESNKTTATLRILR